MSRRRARAAFVPLVRLALFVALALVAPSAGAQPAGTPPPAPTPTPPPPADATALERAKELFRQGNELRKAGDCARALAMYRESRSLVPSVANTTNSAVCMAELGLDDEALEMYEELLVRFRSELTDDETKALASAVTALRRRVGGIEVSSNVQSLVVIDGRPRGQLPLAAAIPVVPGTHVLRVIKEGYETFEQRVTVSASTTVSVDAKLLPLRRDVDSNDARTVRRSGSLWVEGWTSLAIGSGLGSGAEASCNVAACSDRRPSVGGVVGVHVGYQLPSRVSFHVGAGYLALTSTLSRTLASTFVSTGAAGASTPVPVTYELRDSLRFSGPFAGAGIGYGASLGATFELLGRVDAGIVLASASDTMRGTVTAGGRTLDLAIEKSGASTQGATAFAMPEIAVHAHFGRFYAGVGAALGIFVVQGPALQTGAIAPKGFDCAAHPGAADCVPASDVVRAERAFGPAFVALPTLEIGFGL